MRGNSIFKVWGWEKREATKNNKPVAGEGASFPVFFTSFALMIWSSDSSVQRSKLHRKTFLQVVCNKNKRRKVADELHSLFLFYCSFSFVCVCVFWADITRYQWWDGEEMGGGRHGRRETWSRSSLPCTGGLNRTKVKLLIASINFVVKRCWHNH